MSHMVIFQTADGNPGYNQFESVSEAVGFVETLRNDQGIENARIFALEEIKFEFKPVYKVELQALTPGPSATSSPAPSAPAPASPSPSAAPAASPSSSNETTTFGTFAPSNSGPSSAPSAPSAPSPAPAPSAPEPAPAASEPPAPSAPSAPTPPADQPGSDSQPTRRGLFGR